MQEGLLWIRCGVTFVCCFKYLSSSHSAGSWGVGGAPTAASGKLLRFNHTLCSFSFFMIPGLSCKYSVLLLCFLELFWLHSVVYWRAESCTFKMDSRSVFCFHQHDSEADREEMTTHTRNTHSYRCMQCHAYTRKHSHTLMCVSGPCLVGHVPLRRHT